MTKPKLTGGTFEAGPKIVFKDWTCWTLDADEPWTEQELIEFGRDFLLIQALPISEPNQED